MHQLPSFVIGNLTVIGAINWLELINFSVYKDASIFFKNLAEMKNKYGFPIIFVTISIRERE